MSVAELTSDRVNDFTRDHALVSTFLTEAILLVGVYVVIDEIIERREARRWSDVMSLGVRALSTRAEGAAEIIRRAVDGLAVETRADGSVDYQEFVSSRAEEVADWLRADDSRARSFAEQSRQSATRLEDAIIRWGPTLIEDPDSAELLNLLPDIVDSARSAAEMIVPADRWRDRAGRPDEAEGATREWTESERQLFKDNLLDVLKHADEFRGRVSPPARSGQASAQGSTRPHGGSRGCVDNRDFAHQVANHVHAAAARVAAGGGAPAAGVADDDRDSVVPVSRLDDECAVAGGDGVLDCVGAGLRAGEDDVLDRLAVDASGFEPAAEVVSEQGHYWTHSRESQSEGVAGASEGRTLVPAEAVDDPLRKLLGLLPQLG